MQKSKQKKSSQKKPAGRTGGRFPVFWRACARIELSFGFQSFRFSMSFQTQKHEAKWAIFEDSVVKYPEKLEIPKIHPSAPVFAPYIE